MSVGSRSRWLSPRRLAMAGIGGIGAALAVGSMAFACTSPIGNTWYSDGSFTKSGPSGTIITAFATGASANKNFQLVAGNNVTPGHEDHACMDNPGLINNTTRVSNLRGFIPNTSGPVVRPAGDWQICFRETNAATATNPVFFSVI